MLGYSNNEVNLYVNDIHPEEKLPYVHSSLQRLAEGKIKLVKTFR
jgi:hypothetical protein